MRRREIYGFQTLSLATPQVSPSAPPGALDLDTTNNASTNPPDFLDDIPDEPTNFEFSADEQHQEQPATTAANYQSSYQSETDNQDQPYLDDQEQQSPNAPTAESSLLSFLRTPLPASCQPTSRIPSSTSHSTQASTTSRSAQTSLPLCATWNTQATNSYPTQSLLDLDRATLSKTPSPDSTDATTPYYSSRLWYYGYDGGNRRHARSSLRTRAPLLRIKG